MRRLAVLVAVLAALGVVPAAGAATVLDRAAAALRQSNVYVDPAAQEHIDAARVRREIVQSRAGPIYVAVLPLAAENEAGGDPTEAVRALAQKVGRRGTYAGVIGNHFRALSDVLQAGEAGQLATQAIDANGQVGVTATLIDFVDRVAAARNNGTGPGTNAHAAWPLILVVLGAVALFLLVRARSRRRTDRAELAAVKDTAREDLVALAEDVQELEQRVERSPPAKAAYDRALNAYARASGAFDRARTPQELSQVAASLDEGRYEMAVAEAALEGKPVPERRPTCFFDPRHGPSTRDVEWAPEGGAPRLVPACEADAQRVERGLEPASRQVAVGGRSMPYWAAPPVFGGYFGGFLPGLLLGEMMAGPLGWGWGGFGGYDSGGFASGGGGFDSGDFGGGGFGGDLGGGGDFGGGGGDF